MGTEGKLYLQIADSIARSIRNGALQRNERLPSLRDLARQRSVSLATATQAYRTLEDSRLIEARPRSGYFVMARPATQLREPATSRPPRASQWVDRGAIADRVLAQVEDDRTVSFGAACPDGSLLDPVRVRRSMTRAAVRHREWLNRYPAVPGHPLLRRAIARHVVRMGCELDPERIVVTNGCLESLSLCLRVATRPGDVVALESPTYFGLLEILESLGLRALEIPTHPRSGMSLDALQLAMDTQPVRAVVTVPTLSNPLGACMPLTERRRLAAMVAERDVALIEDVIYNDLAEQDDRRTPVKAFDGTGHVMICGSFSKTISPGLRLGWLEAGRWSEKVARLKQATSGAQTTVLELAMADLLTQPGHASSYRQLRNALAARLDHARELICASFPRGTRVTDPPGGFILWVELPRSIDTMRLFEACLAESICFAPGMLFSASDRYRHCLRLGVGRRWDERQQAALCRIGALAGQLLAAAPGNDADRRVGSGDESDVEGAQRAPEISPVAAQ
jgi:DNA-binding transcriptional MocR family regulator